MVKKDYAMNKTDQVNQKSLKALNKLKLPDYSARYKRLREIGKSTGRNLNAILWNLEAEMWADDLLMLKM